ncbi:hypothetical protein AURDEDRAFT_170344 [Auricularia subglabra TFB-10046 SS5]|nr:hypothetical protein AURDEDRAFT_170344 [Auricularia subglabra TFB-10046 SS5]
MPPGEFHYSCTLTQRKDGKGSNSPPTSKMEARIDEFLDGVSDPLNPTCCPYCFHVFILSVVNCSKALSALKKYARDFWKSCIGLLVIYAESDVPRLRQALKHNQLKCSERERHKERIGGDSFEIFINALCFLVQTGLTAGPNPAFSAERQKQSMHRRGGIWPTTIKSLLPLGLARTIDALVHWCCVPTTAAPLQLLETYLMTARALVFPRLLNSPRRERLLWALLQALTPGPAVPWSGRPAFSMPRGLAVPLALRGSPYMVQHAVMLMDTLRADFGARRDDAARLVAGHEIILLSALEQLPTEDAAAPCEFKEKICEQGECGLDEAQCEAKRTRRSIISLRCLLRSLLGRENDECAGGQDPRVEIVHDFLERLAAERTCACPRCTEAELSESARVRRFGSCELCRVVRYCSKSCQREDWKRGVPRHKDVCPLICSLLQRGAELGDIEAFKEALEEMRYHPKDMDILYEWAAVSDILPASAHGPKKATQDTLLENAGKGLGGIQEIM